MASTAVKIDCTTCDTTGYENYWRTTYIPAYYSPGQLRRWDRNTGTVVYDGDSLIKIDQAYETLMSIATHVEFNGAKWSFRMLRDPGLAMGQRRLIYSLTRKD
jgi:hypothetical protein